jgi:hypothetical protein
MKKAIQVMATLVAFLLSGQAFAIKVYPTMPPIKDVIGGTATIVADGVKVTGSTGLFGPEFIPNPINKALALVPETTIASSAISGLAKKVVLGGATLGAGIVVGYAFDEMIKGVGWVIENGAVVKPSAPSASLPAPLPGDYYWTEPWDLNLHFPSPDAACIQGSSAYGSHLTSSLLSYTPGATSAVCQRSFGDTFTVGRSGSGCTTPRTYDSTLHGCQIPASTAKVPVVSADLGVLDGFVKDKDGTWQRDLTTQLCGGLESCYQSLSPSTSLTGPSTITGFPQTVTTRLPDGSTTTSVKSPTTTVTYGPNWYDYNPVTTTTTTNSGGTTTTTDDSPETFPNVPDMLGGGNDGLKGIKDGISGTTSSTSPIPYMAWYSFSQQCSEITLTIPVYGPFSTAICPVYATYIWPTLYFFFAVFTWIRCWGIWRDTVLRVRAS